jgi:hypothetical protein
LAQAAKTTLFGAGNVANVGKSAAGDFCQWTHRSCKVVERHSNQWCAVALRQAAQNFKMNQQEE